MADVGDRIRAYWDRDAETYDRSPSHALTDPVEAAAWRAVLRRHLPPPPAHVLEAGAGTGALTSLLTDLGYRVTALDLSGPMLERAREKLRGRDVGFVVGPADRPPEGPFEAVVERHMLWTTPDPVGTLAAWRRVAPEGRLLVLEGLHRPGPSHLLRGAAVGILRRILQVPHDHHDHYAPEVVAALPLLYASTPGPLIEAVREGGWGSIRLERLRDVEWARGLTPPRAISLLETVPMYAVTAS